jgi:LmbE family N-acetylglucosaminyl deacetylase
MTRPMILTRSMISGFVALMLCLGVVLPVQAASAAVACSNGVMNIVAHADDDILFQSPVLLKSAKSGACLRTVYVTAGDANDSTAYWNARESGAKAAYARMAGVSNSWTNSDAGIAGHPITVSTLNGAQHISLAFMRLPDGNMDGSGFSSHGYESLQKLYGNAISSIRAIDGSSSYTLASLQSTLTSLMVAYQPGTINTLDFENSYGDGDHSDHYTVAYLVLKSQQAYTTSHSLTSYMGYPIADRVSNVVNPDLADKSNTFFTYAANDYRTCSTASACASRPEGSWFSRQYTTVSLAPTNPAPAPDPTPSPTPTPTTGGSNVAGRATVTASSENPTDSQTAVKAVDGVVDGYPGDYTKEWATKGGRAGSWINLAWSSPVTLNKIILNDRPNTSDRITGGTLTFSDGSTVAVPTLNDTGADITVSFTSKTTTSVRFTANSVSSTTGNAGLAEIETYTAGTTTTGAVSTTAGALTVRTALATDGARVATAGRAVTATSGSVIRAANQEALEPREPGATPAEARSWIGRSHKVDSPKITDIPSVLGTTFVFRDTGAVAEVRATSMSDVTVGALGSTRLVRVTAEYAARIRTLGYSAADFALRDENGVRYPAQSTGPAGDVAPLGTGTLAEGATLTGAIYFSVPATASGLLIEFKPTPRPALAGRWTTSAP